jgi:hypothetical protein
VLSIILDTEGILEVEECIAWLVGLTYKAKGDWMQGDLQGRGRRPVLKRLWWILVELPKIPSVVGCNDHREGERHSDG